MAKHILFLVHGMGVQNEGWSKSVQQILKDSYAGYTGLAQVPFEERLKLVEVRYDDVFENIRDNWKKETDKLVSGMKDEGLDQPTVDRIIAAGSAPSKDSFLYTHVLDVVLYRFLKLVRDRVRVSVAKQLFAALNEPGSTDVIRWSVLAHSLGTSVTHDTIDAIYRTAIPGIGGKLTPSDTRATVIAMIANVCRILQTDSKVYESFIRPTLKPDASRACSYYLTARHSLDVITMPKKFDPDDTWPDPVTRKANRYQPLIVHHIMDADVHGFEHYLRSPLVHIPLFRALTAPYMISDVEEQAHVEAFQKEANEELVRKVRQVLEKKLPAESASLVELISVIEDYLKTVNELRSKP